MRYGLAVIGVIVVALLAIILIVGRAPSSNAPKSGSGVVNMASLANQSSTVSYTTRPRLVGEEQMREVRISVTPTERRLEILSGYEETVSSSQSYPNSQLAYESFLKAIGNAGFSRSRKVAQSDAIGACPLGTVYSYLASTQDKKVVNSWSSTCSSREGTFAGNGAQIRQIFQNQIPNYNKQVSGLGF